MQRGLPPAQGDWVLPAPDPASRAAEDGDPASLARWMRALGNPLRVRLLWYLTEPHYLEEVASHLQLARQTTKKHLDKLVAVGVVHRRAAVRDAGPVVEYIVDPRALFVLCDRFERRLGGLKVGEEALAGPTQTEPPARPAPAVRVGDPCVEVVRGFAAGLRCPVGWRREWRVGRDRRCDLVLDYDPYVSGRHASIRPERGGFVLTDLHSTNGTRLNGELLAPGQPSPLRHGDLVMVGRTLLAFRASPRIPAQHATVVRPGARHAGASVTSRPSLEPAGPSS